jgi:hypothetical protein
MKATNARCSPGVASFSSFAPWQSQQRDFPHPPTRCDFRNLPDWNSQMHKISPMWVARCWRHVLIVWARSSAALLIGDLL